MALSLEQFHAGFCEEHVNEAEFRIQLRRKAIGYSFFEPLDLRQLDRRLLAHLQGLLLRPQPAWQALSEEWQSRKTGELATLAGIIAFNLGEPAWIEHYFQWAGELQHDAVDLTQDLAQWLLPERQQMLLETTCAAPRSPLAWRLGAECAWQRGVLAPWLEAALRTASPDEDALAAAVPALMRLVAPAHTEILRRLAGVPPLRVGAISALLASGGADRGMLEEAWRAAPGDVQLDRLRLRACVRSHPQEATARLLDWRAQGFHRAALLCGAGGGLPVALPMAAEAMTRPGLSRLAGLVFSALSGEGLPALDDDSYDSPGGGDGGEEADAEAGEDPFALAPVPAPEFAVGWLEANPAVHTLPRLLGGGAITPAWLLTVLQSGFQYQRGLAAEMWTATEAGRSGFDTSAPFHQQRRRLRALAPGT